MGRFKTRFSDFNVKSKLAVLIYMFIASILIMGWVANFLFKTSQTLIILVSEHRVFADNFNYGIEHFYQYELSEDENNLNTSVSHFKKAHSIAFTFSKIDSFLMVMPKEEWVPLFFEIYKEGANNDIKKVEQLGTQIYRLFKISPSRGKAVQKTAHDASWLTEKIILKTENYKHDKTDNIWEELQIDFEKIRKISKEFSSEVYALSSYINRLLAIAITIIVLLLISAGTFTSIKISRSISNPINRLADNFKKIAKGNLNSSINIETNNEIGELSKTFSEIQIGLQEIISYTKKVAKGDYSLKLKPKSNEDELTISLNKMADRLEEAKIRNDQERWVQNGINGLDDQMRGNYTVRELSEKIIIWLSQFLEAELGAIYVYDEVYEQLELTGSVGLDSNEVKGIIKPGEGLVGNSLLQNKLQTVEIKNKFHKIYSATGEMFPEKTYLMPMHYDNRMQGVIELAPIHEFSEQKTEFLRLVSERISVNLGASVARYRRKELLDKTLEQAEKLKAQEDKLKKELAENIRIKENLSRETALLDSMLKIIPDSIHFKDTEGRFLRISESLLDLFGAKAADEIIGKSDFDFYDRKNTETYFEEEKKIMDSGEGFVDKINENINEQGNKTWTSVTKLPMYDETGKCIGTFGISKDITQIKKLEIEVRERNEKLKTQQEELKAINDQLKQQQEELKTRNEELKAQEEELRVANEEMKSQEEELRVANEELAEQTKILTESEKKLNAQQEKLHEANRELKQASQYKSEFLANMSHELRTPLNSLLILSKLLGNNKNGNLTPEQIKSANIIYKSGKDLLELINEILDLSKIEAGKMSYNFGNIPTSQLKSEIMQNFRPVAENKKLALEINQSDNFPEFIYSDNQRLLQIIKNLLSNAFKFTSKGGVKVNFGITPPSTELINPDLNTTNTFYISVEDSGVGIPKNKVNAIFEAFQQADGSISRKYGGTGLGLSISKQLTHVLGGEIHVDSKEGEGSVFTVYLPLDRKLVGIGYHGTESQREPVENTENVNVTKDKQIVAEKMPDTEDIPVFINDDRHFETNQLLVLIIHNEKEKAQKLLDLCHKRKFNGLVAAEISDGIKLAARYKPQAIIISDGLHNSGDLDRLKEDKITRKLPLHLVSRVEDSVFDKIEDLTTPESDSFQNISKNIEGKFNQEYKQVLVVEDDPVTREAIHLLFENKDIVIHEAKNGKQAYEMISTKPFDCVILDLGLPDFSGNELLRKLKEEDIPIPNVIIHTARELSGQELRELQKFSDSIVIKGMKSDERLMDEVTLFLHQVANKAPKTVKIAQEISDEDTFKGKKVLVVDDDIRNVFAIAQILEEREIEVLEAENGAVSIEILKNNPDVDLVLMDIMMPVMDGYDAMKIIRETPETENIPIITLSAKAMKEDYQKAIDSGANDYISKPVDVPKLLSLLKIWLYK